MLVKEVTGVFSSDDYLKGRNTFRFIVPRYRLFIAHRFPAPAGNAASIRSRFKHNAFPAGIVKGIGGRP